MELHELDGLYENTNSRRSVVPKRNHRTGPDTRPESEAGIELDYTDIAVLVVFGIAAVAAAIDALQWAAESLAPHLYANTVEGIGGAFRALVAFGDHALTRLWESLAALPFEKWAEGDSPRAHLNELLQTYGVIVGLFGLGCLLVRWLILWPAWLKVAYIVTAVLIWMHLEHWQDSVNCAGGAHTFLGVCWVLHSDKTPQWLNICVYGWALISSGFMALALVEGLEERANKGEKIGLLELAVAAGVSRLMEDASDEMPGSAPFGYAPAATEDELEGLL